MADSVSWRTLWVFDPHRIALIVLPDRKALVDLAHPQKKPQHSRNLWENTGRIIRACDFLGNRQQFEPWNFGELAFLVVNKPFLMGDFLLVVTWRASLASEI